MIPAGFFACIPFAKWESGAHAGVAIFPRSTKAAGAKRRFPRQFDNCLGMTLGGGNSLRAHATLSSLRTSEQTTSSSLRASDQCHWRGNLPRSTKAAGTEENSYTSDARHCLKMTERGGAGKTEKYKYFPKNLLTFQSNDDKITQPH